MDRYMGQGIGVAILDTGIGNHPDLAHRVIAFRDILGGKRYPYDDNGHGTHVAGILCGSGVLSKGLYGGLAPKSQVIVVKVLDKKGDGTIHNVIAGLRWVLLHQSQYHIRIVNISIGTLPHEGSREEQHLLQMVEQLWDSGMIVVVAAGNYGPKPGSVTSPGVSRKVITVGSASDQYYMKEGVRKIRSYSGRGPTKDCICKPDIVAPGSGIASCNVGYLFHERNGYTKKSGTSMATPIVSGAIAVLLSKYPDMSNVEVKLRLRDSCNDVHLPIEQQGWGQINVEKLIG
ncbi:MAG: S8 family peptidase [Lachnospiraceae bacterium]